MSGPSLKRLACTTALIPDRPTRYQLAPKRSLRFGSEWCSRGILSITRKIIWTPFIGDSAPLPSPPFSSPSPIPARLIFKYSPQNRSQPASMLPKLKKKKKVQPKPPHAPLILLANWTSFCIIVTRFACMAHKFVSSNKWTINASQLSCNACIAWVCHRRVSPPVGTMERAISRTWSYAKGRVLDWLIIRDWVKGIWKAGERKDKEDVRDVRKVAWGVEDRLSVDIGGFLAMRLCPVYSVWVCGLIGIHLLIEEKIRISPSPCVSHDTACRAFNWGVIGDWLDSRLGAQQMVTTTKERILLNGLKWTLRTFFSITTPPSCVFLRCCLLRYALPTQGRAPWGAASRFHPLFLSH